MRKLLIVLCFLSLLSCSKPHRVHSICVDMGRYVSAGDSDSFRMTIEDPINDAVDTIYWHGNKMESEIDEKLHNILAFVEVSKLDSVGAVDRRLFRSVIATDGDMNTISVKEDGSIHLSGSESNENITRLWYGGMADNKIGDLNDYRILNKFLQEEMRGHSTDLYGAYLQSLDYILRIGFAGEEEYSPCINAQRYTYEIESSGSYLFNHSVAIPYLEVVTIAGVVSPPIMFDFFSYMLPLGIIDDRVRVPLKSNDEEYWPKPNTPIITVPNDYQEE